MKESLGKDLFYKLIESKKSEIDDFKNHVTDWELEIFRILLKKLLYGGLEKL